MTGGAHDHRCVGGGGFGKTTVGTKLAAALHCAFLEGDGVHSQANVEKMSQGIPSMDADGAPWLTAIHGRVCDAFTAGQSLVVACSALKRSYRAKLAEGLPSRRFTAKGPPISFGRGSNIGRTIS